MKRSQVLVLAIGGAAVAYLLWRRQGGAGEPQTFTIDGGSASRGPGLGNLGAAVGAGLSAIPGPVGPIAGAVAAAGGAALEGYTQLPEDQKKLLKSVWEKAPNLNVVYYGLRKAGVIKDAQDKRASARRSLAAQIGGHLEQTEGGEAHMLKQLHALARPDVEWWKIDQAGTTHVKYANQPEVFRLPVTFNAAHPLAWALELTSRIFGAPTQAGYGPITGDVNLSETAGFADGNLYAPKRYTVAESEKFLSIMRAQLAKK